MEVIVKDAFSVLGIPTFSELDPRLQNSVIDAWEKRTRRWLAPHVLRATRMRSGLKFSRICPGRYTCSPKEIRTPTIQGLARIASESVAPGSRGSSKTVPSAADPAGRARSASRRAGDSWSPPPALLRTGKVGLVTHESRGESPRGEPALGGDWTRWAGCPPGGSHALPGDAAFGVHPRPGLGRGRRTLGMSMCLDQGPRGAGAARGLLGTGWNRGLRNCLHPRKRRREVGPA
jgi:hypothetical protein